jgi:hypothetical protein|tara:strand:- start:77 stop:325 length:249 start_codon:yes stop_codon:yes gene_type:complete
MSNKLEKDSLSNINELNEGFFTKLFRNLFSTSSHKKAIKNAKKVAKEDPELASALVDLNYTTKHLRKLLKTLCKRNPDHPKC